MTVATTMSTVAAGDELVLFVPAAKQKQKDINKLLPVASEPMAKRLKTES